MVENAPALQKMMTSLYKCCYRDFFAALVDVVDQLHVDPYLAPHARYFLRQVPVSGNACLRVHVALFEPNCMFQGALARAHVWESNKRLARLPGVRRPR